ncbi:MAG TPA: P-loop NTPase fold protein [Nitrososphaeraceae archaeon]|nr:P-loop NTPase fold protein [Nitrososphaeraceae archaeon]
MLDSFKGDGTVIDDKNRFYFQADGFLQRSLSKIREKDQEYRIIEFIDDLDRCIPEKALKILESIKSFFDMEGIIFVIALNYQGIDSIIKEKYGNNPNISGFDYMEKIVQLPFNIPEWADMDIDKFIDSIIEKDVNGSIFENEIRLNKRLIAHSVERNPRQVKRFINDVILTRFVFKKPVDNLIAVKTLKFRQEWEWFSDFIFPDDRREQFFNAYKRLNEDNHALDRWKEKVTKSYPSFFNENDPLRTFLDIGGADKLNSIKSMEEYRRALESVSTFSEYSERLKKLSEDILRLLPEAADTIASMTPLAPFSQLLGKGIKETTDVIKKKQRYKMDNSDPLALNLHAEE